MDHYIDINIALYASVLFMVAKMGHDVLNYHDE